ncbi:MULTISPECIES: putative adenosine monophosphate-protein transferase Fic [unclassified Halomonas]|uniref:putative adenosine monophosphate-protein transferase Fic n=1 Tax=unclassified Halomonas TaxID=2609666 RepID=UPI00209E50C5|nr:MULTISPECIES: putative adenosine monophosphate-protein transferase Fic [unclassified Halomonas]MCP1312900.1 putative adenosine monophosphate-protein transferase Fic [Halomonas sp. 707D7]MCP1327053.1 putative adenosine monophosphate-protein transferase Fic [Halomonas sp. 707D4]
MDKYGTGQDPYCYPDTAVLRNLLGITDPDELEEAERELSLINADSIEFASPPFDLAYLKHLHRELFGDLYDWAGELRMIDIAKGDTRFCNVHRIVPEAEKLFAYLARQNHFVELERTDLVHACAELYGDLNVIHPFREGNGRAQRLLFEHLIINCGYQISWQTLQRDEWIEANIASYYCHYQPLANIFERCIGAPLAE